jgi:hypothetical protein
MTLRPAWQIFVGGHVGKFGMFLNHRGTQVILGSTQSLNLCGVNLINIYFGKKSHAHMASMAPNISLVVSPVELLRLHQVQFICTPLVLRLLRRQ